MLTETLLRAQERQRTASGSDQPDAPQEVLPDSGEQGDEGGDQPHQRARVSSSDFEPFEVIDEEVEGKGSHNVMSLEFFVITIVGPH